MPDKIAKICNIKANYDFFDSLIDFINENFGQDLQNLTIFLPNRRSHRTLIQKISNKEKSAIFLPKIKAILDINYEDFFQFLPDDSAQEIIDELLEIKIINNDEYLFFLSKEIKKLEIFGKLNFEQSFKIAIKLKSFFDDIEKEEINLKILEEIDDSNLSKHRQITLEFLQNFYIQIKNSLLKKNIISASHFQNFIIEKFCQLLAKKPLKNPLLIAGSTGSTLFSKKLIKAILNNKNGFVILHDLTTQNSNQEHHPNFLLNSLCQYLEIKPQKITNIAKDQFMISSNNRKKFIEQIMVTENKVANWQKSDLFNQEELKQDLGQNFKLISAQNEIEEAKIISEILQKNSEKNEQSALISNNQNLVNIIRANLENKNLTFNDSRNLGVFKLPIINFFLLILDFIQEYNSSTLLALLKHPFTQDFDEENLAIFEHKILREAKSENSILGVKKSLEKLKNDKLSKIFTKFIEKFPLKKNLTIARHSQNLINIAEKLSGKNINDLLENEAAQNEILLFFANLEKQNEEIIAENEILSSFKLLFGQISYFQANNSALPIQILSNIEARLLNFDNIIIASLNDGDFPEIEDQNWIGKKIKKDLKIDNSGKIIGQNAYHFCNYLANKKIYLSRHLQKNNSPTLPSPFLVKLQALLLKNNIEISQINISQNLQEIANIEQKEITSLNPKPAANFRLKEFAITDISKLICDPYSLYARKILRLKPLKEIDYENSFAQFGSFVHEALEKFIKDGKENFDDIFENYFSSQKEKLIFKAKFKAIFKEFLQKNEIFKDQKNLVEKEVKLQIGEFVINGKIDRIIISKENNAEIIDYKTGTPADNITVKLGHEPQLTIAALALLDEKIVENISALKYWKLSGNESSQIKLAYKKEEELPHLLQAAKFGLEKLFNHFKNENNGYIATSYSKYDDYMHLKRLNK